MKNPQLWATPLALSLLSAPLLAQLPVYANQVPAGMELSPYPASPFAGGGNFERSELLDLDDNGTLDAVVLDAGYVVFMYDPETFRTAYKVPKPAIGSNPAGDLTANDFALLDEANDPTYGSYGTLVTVGEDGLSTYVWDAATGDFVLDFNTGGDWVDAVQVELADFEADGDLDIYALDVTGSEVHVMLNDGSFGWTSQTSISLPVSIDHFQLPNWHNNARPEIAGTNSSGLFAFNTAGTQLSFVSSTHPTDMLVRVRTGGTHDQVAWIQGPFTSGPEYTLSIYASGGLQSSRQLPNNRVPTTLSAGFWETDAAEDLAMTFENLFDVLVVDYDGSNIATSTGETLVPTPTTNYGGHNQAPVAFGDLDWDGKADLLVASTPAHGVILIHHEEQVSGVALQEGGGDTVGFEPSSTSICVAVEDPTGPDYVGYYASDIYFETVSGAEKWSVTTWRQSTSSSYMDEDTLRNCDIALSAITTTPYTVDLNLPFDAVESTPTLAPTVYHVMITPMTNNDRIVGASYIASFARDFANLGNSQGYIEIADDWTGLETINFDYCTSAVAGAWVRAGHQGSKGLPPLPPGTLPNRSAACPSTTYDT